MSDAHCSTTTEPPAHPAGIDRAIGAVLAALPVAALVTWAPNHLYFYFDQAKALVVAGFVAALAIGALVLRARGRLGGALHPGLALLGLATAHLAIVTWLTPAVFNDGFTLAKYGLVWATAVVVAVLATPASLPSFGRWFGSSMLAIAGVTGLGWMLGLDAPGLNFRSAVRELVLTMANPNVLACFLVMATPIVIQSALGERSRPWRIVLAGAAVVVPCLVILTGSRNGLASTMIVGAITLAGHVRAVRCWPWAKAIGLGLGFAIVFWGAAQAMRPVQAAALVDAAGDAPVSASSSLGTGRTTFYTIARAMITDDPVHGLFGHGAGAYFPFANTFPDPAVGVDLSRRTTALYVHDEPLEITIEGGAIALVLSVAGVGWIVLGLLRRARSGEAPPLETGWAIAVGAAILGFAGFGLLSVATRYAANQALLGVLLGLGAVLAAPGLRPGFVARSLVRLPSPVVTGAALVLAVVAGAVTWPRFASSRALSAAIDRRDATEPAELARRAALIERAIELDPWNVEARSEHLQRIAEIGPPAAIESARSDLEAIAPCFQDSASIAAHGLATHGRPDAGLAVLRDFLAIHPHDVRVRTRAVGMAVLVGDLALVTDELAALVATAVELAELATGRPYALVIEPGGDGAGGPVLRIDRPDGTSLRIERGGLPGLLLGRAPGSLGEAERLVATNLTAFAREHLGVESAPFLRSLDRAFLSMAEPNGPSEPAESP